MALSASVSPHWEFSTALPPSASLEQQQKPGSYGAGSSGSMVFLGSRDLTLKSH
jgi:hypothetical protein